MKWYVMNEKGEYVEATCARGDSGEDKEAALETKYGTYVGRKVGSKKGVVLYYLLMTGETVAIDVPDEMVKEVMAGP